MSDKGAMTPDKALFGQVVLNALYVSLWITLSGTVIMYNKWILAYYGFPYPITLTMWHMLFSSALAFLCVRTDYVPSVNMTADTYFRAVIPIGALFAGTLWLGNAAYLYLSVSFIQMLKALMPVAVFATGCAFGIESFSTSTLANMIVVTAGVAIASYGEINFVVIGVVLQLISVLTESTRLTMVQILLQRRGLSLNPVTTMYYIAPASFAFLSIPWFFIECRPLLADTTIHFDAHIFVSNAAAAFGLNMAVFLLIGKTSALTMNIAGVIKDWLLIGLSVLIFKAQVTRINLGGYSLAFAGVCWYNYKKLQGMKARTAAAAAQQKADLERHPGEMTNGEKAPLMGRSA
ncbi:plastidic phosphate translocator-like protein [Coccomyxa subellipsoidea C-169]|uniref:Plastidic phosphate translocator-like protein n=1 Tax=Coccomyxa subellipsoidea (strain C-169) TaxID=574566 RepID=I0YUF5_COCSC|nr:plastidic phosphate translocator-like protein [Coccomyxa subellipsoidea C-169]EIE22024.1 plastidic phosphate translocator-like protein [Coccomyxa subellipsoidea C-169]|eukprot:XP_005646568.1 plastidic phosphate translocator-like protein [Coccomyxa subellipsoidea C-169]